MMLTIQILPLEEIASIRHLWLENAVHHSRLAPEFTRFPETGNRQKTGNVPSGLVQGKQLFEDFRN